MMRAGIFIMWVCLWVLFICLVWRDRKNRK